MRRAGLHQWPTLADLDGGAGELWRSLAARALFAGLLLCGLLTGHRPAQAASSSAHHPTSHVFLVQNSGWMEPFFTDPASPYRALIAEVLAAATEPDDLLLLAAFNQSQPGAPSPKALLSSKVAPDPQAARAQVRAALAQLTLAHKPGSSALADTDLNEAMQAALERGLANRPGLIWLFTNNKNSPNNDQATARRNREFYQLIHHGVTIRAALAFPLKMPLTGKTYRANGLMVYLFAVQPEGEAQLQAMLARGRLQKVLTEPAARLKPLDRDAVRLVPQRVEHTPGVTLSLGPNRVLQADVAPDARTPQASIVWQLENTIYPYTIASARVSAESRIGGESRQVVLARSQIVNLSPQQGQSLASSLSLPLSRLPGLWSWAAIKAAGSAYIVPGQIQLQLDEQQLRPSPAFTARMAELFPGDPLPEIFTPPPEIRQSQVSLPLQVRVQYGLTPLLALLGVLGALAAVATLVAYQLGKLRKVGYWLDGRQFYLQGRAGQRYPIHDMYGQNVAQLQIGVLRHQLHDVRPGCNIRLGSAK
jgi:hypothetical protein